MGRRVLSVCVLFKKFYTGILDEEGESDVLVNVNMTDDERYRQNIENKKKKPAYNPYDDSQIDEFGTVRGTFCLFVQMSVRMDSEIARKQACSVALLMRKRPGRSPCETQVNGVPLPTQWKRWHPRRLQRKLRKAVCLDAPIFVFSSNPEKSWTNTTRKSVGWKRRSFHLVCKLRFPLFIVLCCSVTIMTERHLPWEFWHEIFDEFILPTGSGGQYDGQHERQMQRFKEEIIEKGASIHPFVLACCFAVHILTPAIVYSFLTLDDGV